MILRLNVNKLAFNYKVHYTMRKSTDHKPSVVPLHNKEGSILHPAIIT